MSTWHLYQVFITQIESGGVVMIKNISAAGEAASETPRPSTNRELFPRSVAPTIPLNLTPIQKRAAHGRGTMTTESGMAAASAAAAAAAEAASLLEKTFEKADKEEQAWHSAPADSTTDQQPPVETTQPPKRTTINPDNTHNTPTLRTIRILSSNTRPKHRQIKPTLAINQHTYPLTCQ